MVYRVYVEKRAPYGEEARRAMAEFSALPGAGGIERVRLLNRYDVEGLDEALFRKCLPVVFAEPLNMIYSSGRFDYEGVRLVSEYLRFLAPALPLYGVCMLAQKGCSALMDMRPYAVFMVLGSLMQVVWALVVGVQLGGGMPAIAFSTVAFYLVADDGAGG